MQMKMRLLIFSRVALTLTVMFLLGIVASGLLLFVGDVAEQTLPKITVSVTFLLGLIAVYALAANKNEKIVYIEKKRADVSEVQNTEHMQLSQLELDKIKPLIDGSENPIQSTLNEICNQLQAGQGAIYIAADKGIELKYGYALSLTKDSATLFDMGEGLVGRVAVEGKTLYIDKLPPDYLTIFSGLGSASPSFLAIVPISDGTTVHGIIEISTFHSINKITLDQLESIGALLTAEVFNKMK